MDKENDGSIKPIGREVSMKICTAQVVVSLPEAIRQLIDNSIDAGASTIEIRCKGHGFESLEVDDNGSGIEADNFDNLCKPHSTSKLRSVDDFDVLNTLGFRGEALNALCTMGNVTIVTKYKSDALGSKLTFDHRGEITERKSVARQVGTTVSVDKLFCTLPVRRKEFEKSAKREFSKLLQVVQCFALSNPSIKFICSNVLNGRKHQALCTAGGTSTLKEVVSNLFGGGDRDKMLPIEWGTDSEVDEETALIYGLVSDNQEQFSEIRLSGFVSSCEHGCGRGSSDRQSLYVNGRPVDYPKVCRAINEVYQQYNRGHYPTLVLKIDVPPSSLDVNITPDKRTVFFAREKALLAVVRSAVLNIFRPLQGTQSSVSAIRLHETSSQKSSIFRGVTTTSSPIGVPSYFDMIKDCSATSTNTKRSRLSDLTPFANSAKRSRSFLSSADVPGKPTVTTTVRMNNETSFAASEAIESCVPIPNGRNICVNCVKCEPNLDSVVDRHKTLEQFAFKILPHSVKSTEETNTNNSNEVLRQLTPQKKATPQKDLRRTSKQKCERAVNIARISPPKHSLNLFSGSASETAQRASDDQSEENDVQSLETEIVDESQLTCSNAKTFSRTRQLIDFDMSSLSARMKSLAASSTDGSQDSVPKFTTSIEDSACSQAERELDKALRKDDFLKMEVIGQFNNGFIITRLQSHLFIVDQHASDEKYNFERLQRTEKIGTQRLLTDQPLCIGAVQEAILLDNIDIFRGNGFDFTVNEEGVRLCSVPVLKEWQFNKDDIEEILTEVTQYPGVMYRPQKLRKIFASKACRSSIMVGTGLSTNKMKTIVRNLATLDHPWSCPHGRPTLRHLVDLQNLRRNGSVSQSQSQETVTAGDTPDTANDTCCDTPKQIDPAHVHSDEDLFDTTVESVVEE